MIRSYTPFRKKIMLLLALVLAFSLISVPVAANVTGTVAHDDYFVSDGGAKFDTQFNVDSGTLRTHPSLPGNSGYLYVTSGSALTSGSSLTTSSGALEINEDYYLSVNFTWAADGEPYNRAVPGTYTEIATVTMGEDKFGGSVGEIITDAPQFIITIEVAAPDTVVNKDVADFAELKTALSSVFANDGNTYFFTATGNININETILIPRNVTLIIGGSHTMSVSTGVFTLAGGNIEIQNNGTLLVNGGKFIITSGSPGGTVTVDSGGKLNINGASSTVDIEFGEIIIDGELNIVNGTLTVDNNGELILATDGTMGIASAGVLVVDGGTVDIIGDLTINGGTLTVDDGIINFDNNVPVQIAAGSNVSFNDGVVNINAVLNFADIINDLTTNSTVQINIGEDGDVKNNDTSVFADLDIPEEVWGFIAQGYDLVNLEVAGLTPNFIVSTKAYTVNVDNLAQSLTIEAIFEADVPVLGTVDRPMSATFPLALHLDDFTFTVVAKNGPFVITVTRLPHGSITAALNEVTISGTQGLAFVSPQPVTITLSGSTFVNSLLPGMNVSWITNLPAGLTATISSVNAEKNQAVISISGTPKAASNAVMAVVIPSVWVANATEDIPATNASALFDISGFGDGSYTLTVSAERNSEAFGIKERDITVTAATGSFTGDEILVVTYIDSDAKPRFIMSSLSDANTIGYGTTVTKISVYLFETRPLTVQDLIDSYYETQDHTCNVNG